MAITDLTNTTWYIQANVPSKGFYEDFKGTASYNGSSYSFHSYQVYSDGSARFENMGADDGFYVPTGNYYTVTFNENPADTYFHNYVETNGIQLKVTDLTGTTWNIPAGYETVASYGGFKIRYYPNNRSYLAHSFWLGYSAEEFLGEIEPAANSLAYADDENGISSAVGVPNTESFILASIEGTDSTNPKLIAWLSKYGELEVEEEPTAIFDLSSLNLSAGTYSIAVRAKAEGYADSEISEAVSYVVEAAPKEITFDFYDDAANKLGTYTALEEMTWEQFVDSEYNTNSDFSIGKPNPATIDVECVLHSQSSNFGMVVYTYDATKFLYGDIVSPNDVIISGQAYCYTLPM